MSGKAKAKNWLTRKRIQRQQIRKYYYVWLWIHNSPASQIIHAFLAFLHTKKGCALSKKDRERVKRLMRSRKWLLFQEKLKRPLLCADCKRTEGIRKVKSVYIVIISNITGTQRHPMIIIAKYKTEWRKPFLHTTHSKTVELVAAGYGRWQKPQRNSERDYMLSWRIGPLAGFKNDDLDATLSSRCTLIQRWVDVQRRRVICTCPNSYTLKHSLAFTLRGLN